MRLWVHRILTQAVPADSIRSQDFSDTSRTRKPQDALLTVRAIDTHKPKAEPYKLTLDRGLQLRIAPDGARTLLVRYTVKGTDGERQHRLPREYGEGSSQIKLAAACAEAARIRALALRVSLKKPLDIFLLALYRGGCKYKTTSSER